MIVGIVGVMALAGAATLAARGLDAVGAAKQWSIVNFADPVWVANTVVMGPVLVVHDSEKMARGEACTTFYRFKPGKGPTDEIVSFHCRPRPGTLTGTTTFTTVSTEPGCKRLVEYQIGGDAEVHGVPAK
jgi:hypothetical protein